jgi:hypothetical protein
MLSKIEDQPERLAAKRPYQRPALQIFGKVLHLTQGSGTHSPDGATSRKKRRGDD